LKEHVEERAAVPKYVEIVDELPKTAVGKILKNDLRKMAIKRVYTAALAEAGLDVVVNEVVEHKKKGLVAQLFTSDALIATETVVPILGAFSYPWEWVKK